jgi:hypothetical protein
MHPFKLYRPRDGRPVKVLGESDVADKLRLMNAAEEMAEALKPIARRMSDDPGTSDLYNDQPVGITLGDVRRAWSALRKAGVRW